MAITLESIQSTTYTSSGTLTITKPVNLAVGDLMVAFIQGQNANNTPPSGWTTLKDFTPGSGNSRMWVYYIIATSTQTAASDFSWTNSSVPFAGSIVRITGHNAALPVVLFGFDDDTGTATPTFTSTVTPETASSMLLFCLGTYQGSATTRTASGYAVATSNPSWTEQIDQTVNTGSVCYQMSIASATRPQITATGDATVTLSGTCTDSGDIMVVVRPQVLSTSTETETVTDSTKRQVNKVISHTESIADTLIAEKDRIWVNPDKTSTSWVNQDKS